MMKRRLCSVLLCCVMLLGLLPTVAGAEDGLTEGGTYYFDLSGANLPGSINSNLAKTTLHYVPFTYVGGIDAYKLESGSAKRDAYEHHLFIANYVVISGISWDTLNENDLIFGRDYISNGATYTMRAPSVGSSSTGSGESMRGNPSDNEWDKILSKNNSYIKNSNGQNGDAGSWGQDTLTSNSSRRICRRDYNPTLTTFLPYKSSESKSFRPVLEIQNPDELKVVTLDLKGGRLKGLLFDGTLKIVVKKDGTFAAPVLAGLTPPTGHNTSDFKWKDNNGKIYAPGNSVPAGVTKLTAEFTPSTYKVTLDAKGGTINSGDITSYTYGVGAKLPTADDMTYTGHTFEGWYEDQKMESTPVTEIGKDETNYKYFYAKWVPSTYTVTLDANGGKVADGQDVTGYTYGQSVTLPTDVTKTGYDFLGWYSGDEKVTSIGTTETDDKTFTAKWQASTYTVTLHTNDGTIAEGKDVTEYTYGVGATLPTEVTRRGYTFKGWYSNEELTGDPVTAIGETETGHKEYWAKWEANRYYYNRQPKAETPVTSPGTADGSAMGLWGFLCCASLAAGYAVTAAQRRRKDAR